MVVRPSSRNPGVFPSHQRASLFYSDAWNQAWLKAFSSHPAITVYPGGFYTYTQRLKGLLPARSATLVGASSPATRSIRAEYACLTDATLLASLATPWHQFTIPDVCQHSPDHDRVQQFADAHRFTVYTAEQDTAYSVDLDGIGFQDYLATLSGNTRRRLYHRRKRLAQLGTVSLENLWPDQHRFFELLNRFHKRRWGKPCYSGRNLEFMEALLTGLAASGHKIDLSVMSLSGEPVSVVLDIVAHDRCYNIQSGYTDSVSRDVSLGTLHLGYQIEAASHQNINCYDFMAGSGKHTQYKSSLANVTSTLVSLRVVRSPLLKVVYKMRKPLA
ncbi:GNAT family N-acetyltransferase [Marinimicrobium sp. ARAG 43.8]|uniref:GNAT family N-acetyltransferase n=1 Tax=Marinimicrobium sp. ARAG 43.8 TaxID=3418719 RepID=UPI003CF6EA6F